VGRAIKAKYITTKKINGGIAMGTNFKRGSFVLVLVLFTAITLFTLKPEAQATATFYSCTVISTGPMTGTTYVMLTDAGGAFTQRWFPCNPNYANQILATALTAVSLGKTVLVYLDLAASVPTINGLLVNP
jgi:hypothetical protein